MSATKSISLYRLLNKHRRTLSIAVTAIIALAFVFLWWIVAGTVDRNIERIIKTYGQSISNGLAVALTDPIRQQDNQIIQAALDSLKEDEAILTIEVFEENGELLAQLPQLSEEELFSLDKRYRETYSRYGKHPRLFVKSVYHEGKRLGFIAVRVDISRLDNVHKKITHRTLIAALIALLVVLFLVHLYFKQQMARLTFE